MLKLELTQQETNALTDLINLGVLNPNGGGLRAAPAAAHLLGKLDAAAKAAQDAARSEVAAE